MRFAYVWYSADIYKSEFIDPSSCDQWIYPVCMQTIKPLHMIRICGHAWTELNKCVEALYREKYRLLRTPDQKSSFPDP